MGELAQREYNRWENTMSKHFYAGARIHQSSPEVAFCFATKKERDAFISRYNADSTDSWIVAWEKPADHVHKLRKFRGGIHFLYMVSGDVPRWRGMREYTPDFYAIGFGEWPKERPYPTYPYTSTPTQS